MADNGGERHSVRIGTSQDFFAGLFFVVLALFVFWQLRDLSSSGFTEVGSGTLPRWVAAGIGLCGLGLVISGFRPAGERLRGWALRGPLFVCVAIIAFAFTVRSFGLLVACPLCLLFAGLASREVRYRELVPFGIAMTIFCIVLFRYALQQPLPVLIIPGFIHI